MRISDCSSDVCSSDLNFYAKGAWNSAVYASMSDSVGIRVSTSTGVRIYSPQVYLTGHGIKSDGESEGLIIENPTIVSVKRGVRSEEHTSELQSLMRYAYAVFCLKKKISTFQSRMVSSSAH